MKLLLDQTEETILRMKKFTFKSIRKTENDLQLTTWWTDARLQNIYFLIIPREKELFLTDQGHTFNLIKEEKSPLINKRKKVFLKSLLLSLEAFQEGENLKPAQSRKYSLLLYSGAHHAQWFCHDRKMVGTKKTAKPLVMNNQNLT